MCGLSLAWVTSENSTMLLESDSSWLTVAGPYPMLPRFSAVRCLVLTAPGRSSTPTSAVRLSALQPPTLLSCRQLSFASLYHFRIQRDFMSKNPLSGFAPKQTSLLWRPTHIVLHWEWYASYYCYGQIETLLKELTLCHILRALSDIYIYIIIMSCW